MKIRIRTMVGKHQRARCYGYARSKELRPLVSPFTTLQLGVAGQEPPKNIQRFLEESSTAGDRPRTLVKRQRNTIGVVKFLTTIKLHQFMAVLSVLETACQNLAQTAIIGSNAQTSLNGGSEVTVRLIGYRMH